MKKKTKSKGTVNIIEHVLVSKHVKLSEKEKKALFETYNIGLKELPKIRKNDRAIVLIKAEEGDVIKIIRKSHTAGESVFYRGVVDE